MSTLKILVVKPKKIVKHPNADKLGIATVLGWDVICKYDPATKQFDLSTEDKCVYFPPNSILPADLVENRLQIAKYCAKYNDKYRVKACRLRGEASYGVLMKLKPDENWAEGTDVAEHFGVTKYDPEPTTGQGLKESDYLHKYTDIENLQNYPDILVEGEEVVFTEKIHGTNCRVGIIPNDDADELKDKEFVGTNFIFAAGSHAVRRRHFDKPPKLTFKKFFKYLFKGKFRLIFGKPERRPSMYWEPLDNANIRNLLVELHNNQDVVVVFGEIFGGGVQDMNYGLTKTDFRVFDISINGKYMDFDAKNTICQKHSVSMVPILYRGSYSIEKVKEFTSGETTLATPNQIKEEFKGREGIVITPTIERKHPTVGRVIFKSVSVEYIARKGGTEKH